MSEIPTINNPIQPNQVRKFPSSFSKYESDKIQQLISDTLILDLTDEVALQYINRRSPVFVSYEYYRPRKTKLKNNKDLYNVIANHKRVGYVAAYFDTINEVKFVKSLVIRALYNNVNDNADGKSIASLAMAVDKLEQTFIVLNTGSPFMEMIVDELVKNNTTNSNNIEPKKSLILSKGKDFDYGDDIQGTISGVLDGNRPLERNDSESEGDGDQIRKDVKEAKPNPPSSLLLPEDDDTSGAANARADGSVRDGDTTSTRRLSNGEDVDSTGVDTSEAIFR